MPKTNLLTSDDQEIMSVLIEIVAKWADERPEAARQGLRGILPALLATAKHGKDISSQNVNTTVLIETAAQIISDIDDGNPEMATTRIDSFLDGPVPNQDSSSSDDPDDSDVR